MPKQVIEKHFRESIVNNSDVVTIEKIQVNQHAHTSTDADFFFQTEKLDYKVECKQVTLSRKRPNFNLSRFTQEFKLSKWDKALSRNRGFLFLVFWGSSKKSSHAFFIPIEAWLRFREQFPNMKSFDRYKAFELFCPYIVETASNHKFWQFDL